MSPMQAYAQRPRAIPNPSHALRAYIYRVEHRAALNAEEPRGPDWQERSRNINARVDRCWRALSEDDKERARGRTVPRLDRQPGCAA